MTGGKARTHNGLESFREPGLMKVLCKSLANHAKARPLTFKYFP